MRAPDASESPARFPLLRVEQVAAGYGKVAAVSGASLEVAAGETVCVVGPNGAGKTTLMKVIGGVHPAAAGDVLFGGASITRWAPRARAQAGLVHVPEGAQSFAPLSVQENLEVPFLALDRPITQRSFEFVFELFPVLAARRKQRAGTLSGGELRMLSIARGLVLQPRVLVLDEPTLGLSAATAHHLLLALRQLHDRGLTVLVAEQNLAFAERVAGKAVLMERGGVKWAGPASEMRAAPEVRNAVLGQGLDRLARGRDGVRGDNGSGRHWEVRG